MTKIFFSRVMFFFLVGAVGGIFGAEDKKTTVFNTKQLLEKVRKRHLKMAEKFLDTVFDEKKDCDESCPICKSDMPNGDEFILHYGKNGQGEKVANHAFHVQCLVENLKALHPEKLLFELAGPSVPYCKNYDKAADYDIMLERYDGLLVDLICPLCTDNCSVKYARLHKAYITYLDKLTLKERFFTLDKLPIKYARKTLIEYGKLSPQEKKNICEPVIADILLQKFAIKVLYPSELNMEKYQDVVGYVETMLIHHRSEAVREAFGLLKKRPISLEFATLVIKKGIGNSELPDSGENLDQKTDVKIGPKELVKGIFLWALEAYKLLAPNAAPIFDLSNHALLDEHAQIMLGGASGRLTNVAKLCRVIGLAKVAFPFFTEYERGSYYQEIYKKGLQLGNDAPSLVFDQLHELSFPEKVVSSQEINPFI